MKAKRAKDKNKVKKIDTDLQKPQTHLFGSRNPTKTQMLKNKIECKEKQKPIKEKGKTQNTQLRKSKEKERKIKEAQKE